MVTKGGDRDIVIGAIVVLVGAALFAMAYSVGGKSQPKGDGYTLTARFHKADGITVGSAVRLSGVPVGRVIDLELDDTYRAVTTLQLARNVALTDDTAAAIQTDGLLGAKYIELKPGGDEAVLKPGSEIRYTQDAVVVEDLLQMIIQQGRAKRGYLDKPVPSLTK
ncbi:MAG: outer membrane lipid asymmetry maintenance protein MlaD [Actinomycetota bacterium]